MASKVGKLIKEARTNADMTQEQLARKISGLSAADISKAERGEKELTQEQLKKIAKVTGVTQKSLLDAAKGTTGKKTTAKKTTATARKVKTPSNANTTMRVTATEKKLIEYYRLADSNTKKEAMNVLKPKELGLLSSILETAGVGDLLGGSGKNDMTDLLGDALGSLLGGK